MAIDLYTGPLSRYYSGLWENPGAAYAKENNLEYQVVRQNSDEIEAEVLSPKDVEKVTQEWLTTLEGAWGITLGLKESLEENYQTSRFQDFELFYLASHYVYTLDEEIHDFNDEEKATALIQKVEENFEFIYFRDVEVWFPSELPGGGVFRMTFLDGTERTVSSTALLLEELNLVSQRLFNKSMQEIAGQTEWNTPIEADLMIFYEHALYSLKHQIPIILDL